MTNAALRANITIGAVNSEGLTTDRMLARELFLLSGFMEDAAKSTGGKIPVRHHDWTGSLTVLLTRGKEVELRQGSTLDVVFDRPVSLE